MKIVLVTGTRDDCFDPFEVNDIVGDERPELIIHGDCPTGIDAHVKQWAIDSGIPQIPMPAQWHKFGKKAGFLRNEDMCHTFKMLGHYGHELICLGFPKGTDWSGTRHCMSRAEHYGFKVKEFVIDVV